MANIVGTRANATVKPSDKFRLTFGLQQFPLVGGSLYDAPQIAALLVETLPRAGFAPVSNPAAISGNQAIVIDVRLSAIWSGSWTGKTVADVVTALDRLAVNATTFYNQLVLNDVHLLTIQALSLTLTSQELSEGQQQAQTEGEQLLGSFVDNVVAWLQRFATGAGAVVAVVVVGGLAYFWYKRR